MPTAELAHSLGFPHHVRSVSSLWTGRVLVVSWNETRVVWGTRVSNLLFMRLAAEWTVWRGKNRLRDSDNDRLTERGVKGIRVWRTK
jgi:hypothetical protein